MYLKNNNPHYIYILITINLNESSMLMLPAYIRSSRPLDNQLVI